MKKVLVVGSTGQQGSSVVRALSQTGRYFCLALTRNSTTPKAERIASLKNVQLVSADLLNILELESIFNDAQQSDTGPIWGLFVALAFPGFGAVAAGEETQGKNILSIAIKFNVQCYIYSSVIPYWRDEQDAPAPGTDRQVKASIEQYVKDSDIPWTIVRPGFFMENLSPGIMGRLAEGVLRYAGGRVQLVAAQDIGAVSRAVFDDPAKFSSKVLDVAGDCLSSEERSQVFMRVTGRDIPSVPILLISILYRLSGTIRQVIWELRTADEARSLYPNGYNGNPVEASEYVRLTNFEEWARRGTQEDIKSLWDLIWGR